MPNYISISDISNNLGIYEYEIQTTLPTGTENAEFEVGDTLTGGTSTETMYITKKMTETKFFVNNPSGAPTMGEVLSDVGGDTANLLVSDINSVQDFINRSQSIIETMTRKKMLNTGTTHQIKLTTRKNKNLYKFPAGKLPIISVDTVVSDTITYTGSDTNGFYLDKERGLIDFSDGSQDKKAKYHGNLIIDYTYGDASATVATIPHVIIEAVVSATQYMWERYNQVVTAPGATSINPAGFAMSFKQEELFDEAFIKMTQLEARWLL